MPINPGTGLFARIWKFVDQFSAGEDITRADLDVAIDDLVPAINVALGAVVTAQTAAAEAEAFALAAEGAGAAAGAEAGAAAAEAAAALQVASAAAFAGQADAARLLASEYAESINPLNLVALAAETTFTGNLDTLNPTTRVSFYRLAAGVTNGPASAGNADFLLHMRHDAGNAIQVFFDADQLSVMQTRVQAAGVWGTWVPIATRSGDQAMTGGRTMTAVDDGTRTSGTYIPSPTGGNLRRCVNGGAFTLSAPIVTGDYELTVQITNNASAGIITFSGFNRVVGDAMTTTNGDDFLLVITKINGFILCERKALQ